MSTTAPSQAKATPRKAAPAADKRRAASGSAKSGQGLRIRYYGVMRPQRVYSLVVEVDDPLQADGGKGGVVVVRPVIAGAQVVPAEQRLDVSTRGNQITFHVTPLARGKLPEARLDVFSPGQPVQEAALPLKVKSGRLALILLVLAFVMPFLLKAITVGDWRMQGKVLQIASEKGNVYRDGTPDEVLGYEVQKTLSKDVLGEIWLVNSPVSEGSTFTLNKSLGDGMRLLYFWTIEAVKDFSLRLIVFVLFLALALVAWMFSRSRRTYRRYRLSAPVGAEPAGEPAALQPL
jgi:hypothetical protein